MKEELDILVFGLKVDDTYFNPFSPPREDAEHEEFERD